MIAASKAMEDAPRGGVPPSQPLSRPQPSRPAQLLMLWQNPVGKKFLMAVTGIVLSLYVLAHLLGNLQIYMGADKINAYAHLLHANEGLLWSARIVLLVTVGVHALAGIILTLEKRSSRPIAYAQKENIQGTLASQTMIYSGLLILFFVVYHVLNLTVGDGFHPDYKELEPYHNVVAGFRQVPAAIAYIIAMVGVGGHLWHGLYSMFHSLGFRHPRYTPGLRAGAATLGTLIALGDISIPLAVLTGLVR
jgi:succinate dehydrogenase / fumarate reductase, cytochrome b subunit